jgi:uncharacterized protein YjbI with pentapeptide repeats
MKKMKKISAEELEKILELHGKWLSGKKGGKKADLSGTDLKKINLSGADLRGIKLSGADLSYSNLSGTDLNGALLDETNMRGANLSEANLSGANLYNTDLRGALLDDTCLRGAQLTRTNLCGTDLRKTSLKEAVLDSPLLDRDSQYKFEFGQKIIISPCAGISKIDGCVIDFDDSKLTLTLKTANGDFKFLLDKSLPPGTTIKILPQNVQYQNRERPIPSPSLERSPNMGR